MKRIFIIIGVLVGSMLVLQAQDSNVQTLYHFNVPEYDDEMNMTSQLFGDKAEIFSDGAVKITGLRIEFYKGTNIDLVVTSPVCNYNKRTKAAESEADVRIARDNLIVTGQGFTWNPETEQFRIKREAKVVLKSSRQSDALKDSEENK